jgi:hypothetical protein
VIAGGKDGSNRLSSCELFDLQFMQWFLIATLNKQRSYAAAATHESTVYVFGGYDGSNYYNDAEQYDRRADKWTLISKQMSVARISLAAATVFNAVYLVGGVKSDQKETDVVECYDFVAKQFSREQPQPLLSARSGLAAVGIRVSAATYANLAGSSNKRCAIMLATV